MAAALYIHIPFCAGKCAYCDFVSFAGRRRDMARYLCALKKEICARAGVNLALLYAQKQRMAIPQMREDVGFICLFAAFR